MSAGDVGDVGSGAHGTRGSQRQGNARDGADSRISPPAGSPLRLLDLFCGAGGCAVGYARAGFEVVGVDIEDHPDYPFEFHQADAMTFPLDGFDAIHASPPCQAFSDMQTMPNARHHDDLLTPTRERLKAAGVPWVIENVEGAPLNAGPPSLFADTSGVVLCGSMFDLYNSTYALRRHRLFESNVILPQPRCRHRADRITVGFYGDHARIRARLDGHKDRGSDILGAEKMQLVKELMGIDWMGWNDANQAVPPAYTEWIGRHLLEHITEREPALSGVGHSARTVDQ